MVSNGFARFGRSAVAAFAAAALVTLAVRLRGLNDPIEFDPIVYLTIGSNVLDGHMPYRDLFDHKGR